MKKKKVSKSRILAILLALAMACSATSLFATAEGGPVLEPGVGDDFEYGPGDEEIVEEEKKQPTQTPTVTLTETLVATPDASPIPSINVNGGNQTFTVGENGVAIITATPMNLPVGSNTELEVRWVKRLGQTPQQGPFYFARLWEKMAQQPSWVCKIQLQRQGSISAL